MRNKAFIPMSLTIMRFILVIPFAILLLINTKTTVFLSFLIYIIASITDWLDGYFARKFNVSTAVGAFLDPLADKFLVIVAFSIFSLKKYVYLPFFLVILLLIRESFITFMRIEKGELKSKEIKFKTSFEAKIKTTLQMVTIILFYFFHAIKFQFIGIQNLSPQLFYLPLIFFSISLIAAYYSGFTYIKSYPALAEQTFTKVISTFCYTGYFPFASGTFTSLLILIFYLFFPPDIIMLLILFIIVVMMGLYFSGKFENRMMVKDPSYIVIDEVSGMLLALLPVTLIPYASGILFSFFPGLKDLEASIFNFSSIANFSFKELSDIRNFKDFIYANHVLFIILSIMQFVLFRIFDIFKPLGIRSMQSIKAGPGIMIDDLIAGLYSIIGGFIIFVLLFIGLRL